MAIYYIKYTVGLAGLNLDLTSIRSPIFTNYLIII